MSEPAAPLLSRRAALIAGTVATGTVWVTPIATSISMTTAHAASGAPDTVRGPGSKPGGSKPGGSKPGSSEPGQGSRPKPPEFQTNRPKPPNHNYNDLRASGSRRGVRKRTRLPRRNSYNGFWFRRVWAWIWGRF
jgi:hypothetical protein